MFPFFVFMLFCTLLLPATMLFFGRRWQKSPPKEISGAYGYRTRRSMSGKAAWDFAHSFISVFLRRIGLTALVISAVTIAVLGAITLDTTTVAIVAVILVFLQFVPFLASAVLTERALKEKFGN